MSSVTPPRIGRMMSMDSPRMAGESGDGSDMYDALRDLFLGGQESGDAEGVRTRSETHDPNSDAADSAAPTSEPKWPRIEALVLGHLPVQQSVWVMQYAKDAAAQRGGPVGLLRIREGEATLDLVGTADIEPEETPQSIADAIVSIAPFIKSLIIRVDPTTEPLLPGMQGVDSITLLTGSDEAAIVGSYRTIKNLVGHAADHLPPMRLAIMGSTTEKALAAADKIQRAVETHLHESLVVTACLARINAGKTSLVYRGLLTDDVGTILERLPRLLGSGDEQRSVPVKTSPTAPVVEPTVTSRLGFAASAPAEVSRPQATTMPSPATPASPMRLSSHIAGLNSTPIVCPYHGNVEVAVGSDGRVHLIASATGAIGAWNVAGELLSAGAWAASHASILALALGQPSKPGAGSVPVLHLMLSEAKGARELAQAGIRPHLLAPVRVEGKTGWFCTELD